MFYIAIMLMERTMRTSSDEVIGCLTSESCVCSFLFKLSKPMKFGLLKLLDFTRLLYSQLEKGLFSFFLSFGILGLVTIFVMMSARAH